MKEKDKEAVIIRGHFNYLNDSDKITITLLNENVGLGLSGAKKYISNFSNHSFLTEIPDILSARHISITWLNPKKSRITTSFIIEPGDSIDISNEDGEWRLSGRNSVKFICKYEIDRILNLNSAVNKFPHKEKSRIIEYFKKWDSTAFQAAAKLEQYKSGMSEKIYNLLKAELIAFCEFNKIYPFYYFADSSPEFNEYFSFLSMYKNPIWNRPNQGTFIESKEVQSSEIYLNCLLEHYQYDSCRVPDKPFDMKKCYSYFARTYSGAFREALVFNLIMNNRNRPQNVAFCIDDALSYVKNKTYRSLLSELKESRIPGAFAYDFALLDTRGKINHLSDFSGKVVLLDFWYTGCGNCVRLHPILDSIMPMFREKPFVFITISNDENREMWLKSVASGKYASYDDINLYTNGKGYEHPAIKKYKIDGYPTLVLIDKKGRMMSNPVDPRLDKGKNLVELIDTALSGID